MTDDSVVVVPEEMKFAGVSQLFQSLGNGNASRRRNGRVLLAVNQHNRHTLQTIGQLRISDTGNADNRRKKIGALRGRLIGAPPAFGMTHQVYPLGVGFRILVAYCCDNIEQVLAILFIRPARGPRRHHQVPPLAEHLQGQPALQVREEVLGFPAPVKHDHNRHLGSRLVTLRDKNPIGQQSLPIGGKHGALQGAGPPSIRVGATVQQQHRHFRLLQHTANPLDDSKRVTACGNLSATVVDVLEGVLEIRMAALGLGAAVLVRRLGVLSELRQRAAQLGKEFPKKVQRDFEVPLHAFGRHAQRVLSVRQRRNREIDFAGVAGFRDRAGMAPKYNTPSGRRLEHGAELRGLAIKTPRHGTEKHAGILVHLAARQRDSKPAPVGTAYAIQAAAFFRRYWNIRRHDPETVQNNHVQWWKTGFLRRGASQRHIPLARLKLAYVDFRKAPLAGIQAGASCAMKNGTFH